MKIAITGKMTSGKSTIAKLIVSLNHNYQIYSYANKIKEIANDLFKMEKKDRNLLINIGTNLKNINKDVWANYIMDQIKINNNNNYIIDDLRFQNELDLLDDQWIIIKLNVDTIDQKNRLKSLYPDNYQQHIKNLNNDSENCNLNFKKNQKILTINTSKESIEEIKKKLIHLIN